MADPNPQVTTLFEIGHFYSPIVDPAEVGGRRAELWRPRDGTIAIDYNHDEQLRLLREAFPRQLPDFDYPMSAADAVDASGRQWYFLDNDQFSNLDAAMLFVMLRELRPERVIEIGSGFSSLLMADVRRRFLGPSSTVQCIEPYPRQFLRDAGHGIELVESKVQDVPLAFFESLKPGDVLFIDSSHVSKTGSDVNYLFFEVVPRLPAGVYVHVHDIFLPNEYPYKWVVEENRSWNEQYLLQAFLMFNPRVRVVLGSSYVANVMPEETLLAVAGKVALYGGSFWFQTC